MTTTAERELSAYRDALLDRIAAARAAVERGDRDAANAELLQASGLVWLLAGAAERVEGERYAA